MSARAAFVALALALAPTAGRAADDAAIAVRVALDRPQVFLHQQVVLSIAVQHAPDARASWEPPPFDGFWAERLGTRALPPTAGGAHRTEFRRALFPTRTGEVEIAASALVLVGEGGQEREVSVPATRVRVVPLPDEVPADTLVGQLEVQVLAGDDRVRLGKALGLVVEISGEGNVWDAKPPDLAPLVGADVEIFPEAPRLSIGESNGRATTRRTFRYALVPAHTGRLEIAALRLAYFDPSRGALAAAESAAQSVAVFEGTADTETRAPWQNRPRLRERAPLVPGWLFAVGALAVGAALAVALRASRRARARLAGPPVAAPRPVFEAALAARDTPECLPLLARAVRAGIQAQHRLDAFALTTDEIAARVPDPESAALLRALDRARFAAHGRADPALIERVRSYLRL